MVVSVLVGEPYLDLGASCNDAVEGDISANVQTIGLSLVVTDWPTPIISPFVVSYYCANSAGSAAETALRYIYVQCPENESICQDTYEGVEYTLCTAGSTQCNYLAHQAAYLSSNAIQEATVFNPTIELIGPEQVVINLNDPYVACPTPRPLSLICDMGATAHFTDGSVATATIEACSNSTNRYSFILNGISKCALDTSVVGSYDLTFIVREGDVVSNITRTIKVVNACTSNEFFCPDYSCSIGGFCLSDLLESTSQNSA